MISDGLWIGDHSQVSYLAFSGSFEMSLVDTALFIYDMHACNSHTGTLRFMFREMLQYRHLITVMLLMSTVYWRLQVLRHSLFLLLKYSEERGKMF